MKHFLSCDWGTSSIRLRLADAGDGKILAETRSGDGIAATFEQWLQSGLAEESKTGFYLDAIERGIRDLEAQTGQKLSGLPVVLSGMASSSIGFIDLPYAMMPLDLDGSGANTALIAANDRFEHEVLIISGAKTEHDVMRGEETQLIGCIPPGRPVTNELFIFPGTHSKHITVEQNQATGLKTYVTGELFSLLANQSILKNSVQPGEFDPASFKQGVTDAASGNLLNLSFKVRTNGLFAVCSKTENYHYLSGLLIGSELKDLALCDAEAINLVCGNNLKELYQMALNELAPRKKKIIFSPAEANAATVRGQLRIARHLDFLE